MYIHLHNIPLALGRILDSLCLDILVKISINHHSEGDRWLDLDHKDHPVIQDINKEGHHNLACTCQDKACIQQDQFNSMAVCHQDQDLIGCLSLIQDQVFPVVLDRKDTDTKDSPIILSNMGLRVLMFKDLILHNGQNIECSHLVQESLDPNSCHNSSVDHHLARCILIHTKMMVTYHLVGMVL